VFPINLKNAIPSACETVHIPGVDIDADDAVAGTGKFGILPVIAYKAELSLAGAIAALHNKVCIVLIDRQPYRMLEPDHKGKAVFIKAYHHGCGEFIGIGDYTCG